MTIQYSIYCILLCLLCIAGFIAQGLQIDPQLFRFLVKMTAFQAQRPGCIGDVMVVPFQFSKDDLAFESLHSLR